MVKKRVEYASSSLETHSACAFASAAAGGETELVPSATATGSQDLSRSKSILTLCLYLNQLVPSNFMKEVRSAFIGVAVDILRSRRS